MNYEQIHQMLLIIQWAIKEKQAQTSGTEDVVIARMEADVDSAIFLCESLTMAGKLEPK